MLQQLINDRGSNSMAETLELYRTIPCLIIDDWMNEMMSSNELTLMREVIDYRARNGGTILISHTHPDNWKDLINSQTSYRQSFFQTMTDGSTFIALT